MASNSVSEEQSAILTVQEPTLTVTITVCGTRKLQLFYDTILQKLKNRPMRKTVNAICKKIIKVKNSFEIAGIYSSS